MIYLTADLHIGHEKIIQYCHRPFETIDEMNQKLVSNWNSIVQSKDTVYVLGDFAWAKKDFYKYSSLLEGTIIFLRGNHDFKQNRFQLGMSIKIRDRNFYAWLSHFQHAAWPRQSFDSYHFYGHSHCESELYVPRSCDVGVDCWNYYPVALEDAIERADKVHDSKGYVISCPRCGGYGTVPGAQDETYPCGTCDGTGKVRTQFELVIKK
jgi:calcineurin-like phosphoesterase family protein